MLNRVQNKPLDYLSFCRDCKKDTCDIFDIKLDICQTDYSIHYNHLI